MLQKFAPYALRSFQSKSLAVADHGFRATLTRNGLAIASIDCGTAPDNDDLTVVFKNTPEMELFQRLAPRLAVTDETMDADERFLRDLAEATYHHKRLSDVCRNSTLFRLPNDPVNSWRQVRAPYRPALVRAIARQYPETQPQFANDVVAAR